MGLDKGAAVAREVGVNNGVIVETTVTGIMVGGIMVGKGVNVGIEVSLPCATNGRSVALNVIVGSLAGASVAAGELTGHLRMRIAAPARTRMVITGKMNNHVRGRGVVAAIASGKGRPHARQNRASRLFGWPHAGQNRCSTIRSPGFYLAWAASLLDCPVRELPQAWQFSLLASLRRPHFKQTTISCLPSGMFRRIVDNQPGRA